MIDSPDDPGFLLDTHIWIWYLTGTDVLPTPLRRVLDDRKAPVWLSPISVWEASLLAAGERLGIEVSFREWFEASMRRYPVREAPLGNEVALRSRELSLADDPADRFIAATALVYDLTLMTVDRALTRASWLPTRSK